MSAAPMTMARAAQLALDVQSACNLSGVVRSFADITSWMRTTGGLDTPTCNAHPVSRLFAEQIAHLTGGGTLDAVSYSRAYDWCEHQARETVPAAAPSCGCRADCQRYLPCTCVCHEAAL